jgi:hypothetical protein
MGLIAGAFPGVPSRETAVSRSRETSARFSLIWRQEFPVPKTSFAVLIPREFNTKPDNSNYSLS